MGKQEVRVVVAGRFCCCFLELQPFHSLKDCRDFCVIMARLFGTDGVRGRANADLTPELAFRVGLAHGYLIKKQFNELEKSVGTGSEENETACGTCRLEESSASGELCLGTLPHPIAAVGRDTRLSGPMLQYGYACGLISSGVNVLSLEVIPTPGVAWSIRHYGTEGGCVISASHNPFHDNGLKLIGADGFKLSDAQEDELEELIAGSDQLPRAQGADLGRVIDGRGVQKDYVSYVESLARESLQGLSIVVDCANGASSAMAETIFRHLGAKVVPIHCNPDGVNINSNCGSTHPQSLREKVVEVGADLGLAFDGDADRCLACDERGEMIDGDHMLLLFAQWLDRQGRLPHKRLITTVMANLGLEIACRKFGFDMARTAVGDRYVLEEMRRSGSRLGGEQSGHIIFLEHSTTGDGMVTGLMLSQIVKNSGQRLSELAKVVEKQPQYLVNVRVKDKHHWKEHPAVAQAVELVEGKLAGQGRLLVRPSGTENLVRVMAEGADPKELRELVDGLCRVLQQYCPPEG